MRYKKRLVSTLLVLTMTFLTGFNVKATDNSDAFRELPENISLDVTMGEIEDSILNYIDQQELDIEYGAEQYVELLSNFLYKSEQFKISQTRLQYYGDYAAHYLNIISEQPLEGNDNIKKNVVTSLKRDTSLADLKAKNQEFFDELQNVTSPKPSVQSRTLYGATEYAKNYWMECNEKYGYFIRGDCTNFASQILHEGWGMPLNSEWNTFSSNTMAQRNWRVAQDFTEYWTKVRGYNGGLYTTRAQVNANATQGDFIAFMRKNSTEIYHVAFVQDKVNGDIYLTQHTPDYFYQRFNDRVTENDMSNGFYVIVINFG